MRNRMILSGLIALAGLGVASQAALGATGDIYISDSGTSDRVLLVDPASGARTPVATGGSISDPRDLALALDGNLYLADLGAPPEVIRITPSSGSQQVVASGAPLAAPRAVLAARSGELFVADHGPTTDGAADGLVVRVDPATGTQAIVTSGGELIDGNGIAFAANGDLLVADSGAFAATDGRVIRVDPVTGAQTVLSPGGQLANPTGLSTLGQDALVSDFGAAGIGTDVADGLVTRVNQGSGAQSTLSSGGQLLNPQFNAIDPNAQLLVVEAGGITVGPKVLRVDPTTGTQSVVSSGPSADTYRGIAIEDFDPPETTITKGPTKKTKKRKAKLQFTADEPGASFLCKLDKGGFVACDSPEAFKKLKRKKHRFQVVATDLAGNVDPTPAKKKWKVKKKKKKK